MSEKLELYYGEAILFKFRFGLNDFYVIHCGNVEHDPRLVQLNKQPPDCEDCWLEGVNNNDDDDWDEDLDVCSNPKCVHGYCCQPCPHEDCDGP